MQTYSQSQFDSKPESAYPSEAVDVVRLISYRKDVLSNFIGSYSYRAQKYPGDIDAHNSISQYIEQGVWENAKDPQKLAKAVSARMQEIAMDVINRKDTYFIEIKAGLDYDNIEFFKPIGILKNGVYIPDKNLLEKTLKYEKIRPDSSKLMKKIRQYLENMGPETYDLVSSSLRSTYIVRWSSRDVINGFIKLPSGRFITLFDALFMPTYKGIKPIVKLDLISYINGRYIEISDNYILEFFDKEGKEIHMSVYPQIDSLSFEIEKFAFSPIFHSLFKCIKRMYSFARLKYLSNKNSTFLSFLQLSYQFIFGDISLLSQLKGDLETIKILYELKLIKANSDKSTGQLDLMRNKLSTIISINGSLLKEIIGIIELIMSRDNYDERISGINELLKILKRIIETTARTWLDYYNFNPIPELFLPNKAFIDQMNEVGQRENPLLCKQYRQSYLWIENL